MVSLKLGLRRSIFVESCYLELISAQLKRTFLYRGAVPIRAVDACTRNQIAQSSLPDPRF